MTVTKGIRNATHAPNDASSYVRRAVLVLAVALAAPDRAHALPTQDAQRAALDSLAARLARTEERLRELERRLAPATDLARADTHRLAFAVRGRMIVNVFANSRRVNSTGTPAFVRPDDPGDPNPRGIGMHMRQSTIGFSVTAKNVWGGEFGGHTDLDFHGGQLPSSGGRFFPLLRIRTAHGVLRWTNAELLFGQYAPLVAGINPISLASVGIPGFASSGNLWMWRPQLRVSADRGVRVRFGVQGAILAPGTGAAAGTYEVPDFDVAERARRPFLQGRARARWGSGETAGEVGLGGHIGWYLTAIDTLAAGKLVALDAIVPLTPWLEVRGEAYDGRGARSLGGGGVSQLFGIDAALVRSRGGWVQVNAKPTERLVVGAGAGVDDPHDTDLPASARLKNSARALHLEWRPAGPLVFGAEYRRTLTTYFPRAFANDHLNLAFGFEF
jgi:hypothetical protein